MPIVTAVENEETVKSFGNSFLKRVLQNRYQGVKGVRFDEIDESDPVLHAKLVISDKVKILVWEI